MGLRLTYQEGKRTAGILFSSTSSRRAFSWLLQYSLAHAELVLCKTRTEPVGDSSQQEGRCWGDARPGDNRTAPDPERYPAGGVSAAGAPTGLPTSTRPSSAPSDVPGSSMAQGQGYCGLSQADWTCTLALYFQLRTRVKLADSLLYLGFLIC